MPNTVIAISLALGAAGAFAMSRYAFAWGLMDIPNDRSSHSLPTPRGGGAGIPLAASAAGVWLGVPAWLWLPAVVLSAVSFLDDKLNLRARTRLLIQLFCGFAVVYGAGREMAEPLWAGILLAGFWVVFIAGTANFFNFMDGINGIAGFFGLASFLALGIYSGLSGMGEEEVCFNLSVAAACAGFLPFNFPKARVFMGDVGSVFIGFLFASQVMRYSADASGFLLTGGFLFMFYADALYTIFTRWRSGEKLSQAHRRHIYQLLANQGGLPHWKVTLGYFAAQASLSALLLWSMDKGAALTAAVLFAFSTLFLAGGVAARKKFESR